MKKKKKENYYKPVRASTFLSKNYIEYKSNKDKNRMLSVQEHLDKIRPFLIYIIYYFKQSDIWQNQLTITINFFFQQMIMMKSVKYIQKVLI